jgi:hypothetical protein
MVVQESRNSLAGTEENHRHSNIRVPDRDVNQAAPEYRLEALTLKPNSHVEIV